MGIQVVAHIPLDLAGRAENEPAPADPSHEDQRRDAGQTEHLPGDLAHGICQRARPKDHLVDDIDAVAHDQGNIRLHQIDDDQDQDAHQIAPLILAQKVPRIRTFEDPHHAALGLFFLRLHASFPPFVFFAFFHYTT